MTINALDALITESGGVQRTLGATLGDRISVKKFGAVGDGVSDDRAAIQEAIDTGRAIYFPAGRYSIAAPLKFSGAKPLILIGEGFRPGMAATSEILDGRGSDDDDEPLLCREEGWLGADNVFTDGEGGSPTFSAGLPSVFISRMFFRANSSNLTGQCVHIEGARNLHINHCYFSFGMRGLTINNSAFDANVHGCVFSSSFFTNGNHSWPDDREKAKISWGLYASGHSYLYGLNAQGCGTAFYMNGNGTNLFGARVENCGYGLTLGANRFTVSGEEGWPLTRAMVAGISLEANAVGLRIASTASSEITGVGIQGSPSSPETGRPFDGEIGVLIEGLDSTSSLSNISAGGYFSTAALLNNSGQSVSRGSFQSTTNAAVAGQNRPLNTRSGGAPAYYSFLGAQMFPGASNQRHKTMTAFHDLMVAGLTGVNVRDMASSGAAEGGPVFARNLGGSITPTSEATSAAVSFSAALESNNINFSADPTLVTDEASELDPGTYYYATTVVAAHGETSPNAGGKKTVTVGADEKVSMTFSNTSQNVVRRIYRGVEDGVYQGYWVSGSMTAFVDAGQPFDGRGAPPAAGNIPARAEDDANYQIIATPSWATTVHVSDKTTAGFTLNFGTAAPDGAQTVAWLLFRP